MYKISEKFIKFITEAMKNWWWELTAGRKALAENRILKRIIQEDALSTLQFVIAMMPLSHILRKRTGGNKFIKSQEQINQLMYIDDSKLFAKNEKNGNSNTKQ